MVKRSRIRAPRVDEKLQILISRLIHTFGEGFGDLAQLNGTSAVIVLERRREINVFRALGVFLDRKGNGFVSWSKHIPLVTRKMREIGVPQT